MLRLGTEPGKAFLMFGISGLQQLHRHRPLQHEVCGPPDLAHPAPGDTVVQPVPAPEHPSGRYHHGTSSHDEATTQQRANMPCETIPEGG
jgi:hypothetical protein